MLQNIEKIVKNRKMNSKQNYLPASFVPSDQQLFCGPGSEKNEQPIKLKVEIDKKELVDDIHCRLFKLKRNLNIQCEKHQLLQQKIHEIEDDIENYEEELRDLGFLYDDFEDKDGIFLKAPYNKIFWWKDIII